MSAKVSVGVAAVFAVFMLGFAQPGGAQLTATGRRPRGERVVRNEDAERGCRGSGVGESKPSQCNGRLASLGRELRR